VAARKRAHVRQRGNFDRSYPPANDHPRGDGFAAMITCRRCGRPTPRHCVGSSGHCDDCRHAHQVDRNAEARLMREIREAGIELGDYSSTSTVSMREIRTARRTGRPVSNLVSQ
jgi:hypothetical protein